ncbi:nucleotide-binding universal stress UspA family protein [Aquamicrobium terrae]
MYSHILVATDGSDLSQRGVDHGLALAAVHGSRVTILHVTEIFPVYAARPEFENVSVVETMALYRRAGKEFAGQVLAAAAAAAKVRGIACETVHVDQMRPAEAIVEVAGDKGCDLIVMTSHGASHGRRGHDRAFLGSQAVEVLVTSPVPVLVVR